MSSTNPSRRTVAFQTMGCRLNQAETNLITKSLQARGYEIVTSEEDDADVYILNTCTVTQHSDAKNRQMIRSVHRNHPDALIAVIGCYAQMSAQEIAEIEGVKLVLGNENKLQIADFLDEARVSETPLVITPKIVKTAFTLPVMDWLNPHQTREHLKIQDGCDFMCSFCIIPFARGRSRSREFDNCLEEARALVLAGAKELVLTGVNVGTYGIHSKTLIHLLDALNQLDGLERIRISSIEPTTVEPLILQYMADPGHKLVPYLHLPLQSGSNEILEWMKRRYTREMFREDVLRAVEQVPDLCVGTDVMVGFPGETDEHFDQTWQLLDSLPVHYFHVFPYSERDGTPAVRMAGKVTPQEKQRRSEVLRKLSQWKRREFYGKALKQIRYVLFEAPKGSRIDGLTDNYIRVSVEGEAVGQYHNQVLPVFLSELREDMISGEIRTGD
ncbi:MAG: tRNA (N(6)-L-threonylcarbamoyladenosine(37)-C(2))-methylthiotransferase MtaB [SAR324 cluster bacterium]|nr:tRNA (N(6)-L-threonylcarbamoyladenosine(37)-C(2))-methylthiotransferase MtaB [SAR324 cluster bacterium]